jgi:hypothetical protein
MAAPDIRVGNVTIDSCEGVPLLTLEAADGHGNAVDVYLDEEHATYLAWKLALTLQGITTDTELAALLDNVEQHLLRKAG